MFDPLHAKSQDWKVDKVSYLEMNVAIHDTHNDCQEVYNLFTSNQDSLICIIQFDQNGFPNVANSNPIGTAIPAQVVIKKMLARYKSGIRV